MDRETAVMGFVVWLIRLRGFPDYDVYFIRTSSTSYPGSLKLNLLSSTNPRRKNAVSRAVWVPKFFPVEDGDVMLWLMKLGSWERSWEAVCMCCHVILRILRKMTLDYLTDTPDNKTLS